MANKNVKSIKKIRNIKKQLLKKSEPELFISLANEYMEIERADEAVKALKLCIKKHPDFIPASIALGDIYMVNGYPDNAVELFEEVIHKEPDNIVALKGLARLYESMGRVDDSTVLYERILTLSPNDTRAAAALNKTSSQGQNVSERNAEVATLTAMAESSDEEDEKKQVEGFDIHDLAVGSYEEQYTKKQDKREDLKSKEIVLDDVLSDGVQLNGFAQKGHIIKEQITKDGSNNLAKGSETLEDYTDIQDREDAKDDESELLLEPETDENDSVSDDEDDELENESLDESIDLTDEHMAMDDDGADDDELPDLEFDLIEDELLKLGVDLRAGVAEYLEEEGSYENANESNALDEDRQVPPELKIDFPEIDSLNEILNDRQGQPIFNSDEVEEVVEPVVEKLEDIEDRVTDVQVEPFEPGDAVREVERVDIEDINDIEEKASNAKLGANDDIRADNVNFDAYADDSDFDMNIEEVNLDIPIDYDDVNTLELEKEIAEFEKSLSEFAEYGATKVDSEQDKSILNADDILDVEKFEDEEFESDVPSYEVQGTDSPVLNNKAGIEDEVDIEMPIEEVELSTGDEWQVADVIADVMKDEMMSDVPLFNNNKEQDKEEEDGGADVLAIEKDIEKVVLESFADTLEEEAFVEELVNASANEEQGRVLDIEVLDEEEQLGKDSTDDDVLDIEELPVDILDFKEEDSDDIAISEIEVEEPVLEVSDLLGEDVEVIQGDNKEEEVNWNEGVYERQVGERQDIEADDIGVLANDSFEDVGQDTDIMVEISDFEATGEEALEEEVSIESVNYEDTDVSFSDEQIDELKDVEGFGLDAGEDLRSVSEEREGTYDRVLDEPVAYEVPLESKQLEPEVVVQAPMQAPVVDKVVAKEALVASEPIFEPTVKAPVAEEVNVGKPVDSIPKEIKLATPEELKFVEKLIKEEKFLTAMRAYKELMAVYPYDKRLNQKFIELKAYARLLKKDHTELIRRLSRMLEKFPKKKLYLE
ncbi:MAG: tetratricopeptide repeat protein [Candidatus Magnetoovum sp. WYHC-5]|nr:tetratricopeptide repeat protein [Candidatus Magnetoovum sp. WYHC-5]